MFCYSCVGSEQSLVCQLLLLFYLQHQTHTKVSLMYTHTHTCAPLSLSSPLTFCSVSCPTMATLILAVLVCSILMSVLYFWLVYIYF